MVAPARYKDRVYDKPEYKEDYNPVFTHYFITSHDWIPLVEKDSDKQRILVFLSRDQASIFAMRCPSIQDFLVIGLTESTWNVFRENEQYIIVSEEEKDNAEEM